MSQTIPVLTLTDFVNGSAIQQRQFVQELGEALEQVGFLALTNHGISAELIQAAYAAANILFSLPDPVKAAYEDLTLKGQRGFTAFGREHAKSSPHPDLKEFWHIGRETAVPGNLWPEEVPAFRPAMLTLFEQLEQCANVLLEACALYLDLPRDFLRNATIDSPTLLRVLHYPPIPAAASPASIRAAAHEDINLLTILCEATTPGLELLQNDGTWLPIAAIPGQLIVDTGDMLQNLTNGLFKSTTHRVTNPENDRDRRFSLPFFIHPRPETDLSPLPTCVARTGGQAKFPSQTAGEYLTQRLSEIGLG
ncbi:2-oxoglutarate and iron-dependent oxygenase domain-containing protein [Oscillatoria sp. CS-180]|uniref:isopenicillin N synthase family dioxygenase n=1 Tax=Oscillatoria sp. CS-180 TaxID=3021720 RepID=UPI00232AAFFB|nr:2-oxoglutarate and iron-dependent oxygenase domain-containing protein [Oscillatoria sp. CS-180]MDB9526046.1 2-oxoglutarate and iron-dependent oxygenase domain-containing protein [Oscillatoria sp. CS-180]